MTVRRLLAVLALPAALAACGPRASVQLGVRDVGTDVLLASPTPSAAPTAAPGPRPPLPLHAPPGFPFVPAPPPVAAPATTTVVPLPSRDAGAPPPVTACPTADPLAGPRYPAPALPAAAPVEAVYPVRVDGSFRVRGPQAASGRYPAVDVRRVHDVGRTADGGAWTYDVTDGSGLTTSYAVRPHPEGGDAAGISGTQAGVPAQPGIYVTAFSLRRADGSVLALAPQPALLVARLPFVTGDTWTARGVDAARQVVVTLDGQTGLGPGFRPSHARVDACGTVLDAWWVQYTVATHPVDPSTQGVEGPSEIRGADLDLQLVGSTVAFAPQFGGIPVEDHYRLTGTDGGDTVELDRHSTYDRSPAVVGSAR